MDDEATTKPTIETVLARMSEFAAEMGAQMSAFAAQVNARFDAVDARFNALESRLEQFEARTANSLQAIEDQLGVLALDVVKPGPPGATLNGAYQLSRSIPPSSTK